MRDESEKSGGLEIWESGDLGVWRFGSLEVWKFGETSARACEA
jgi:hypothetical protein